VCCKSHSLCLGYSQAGGIPTAIRDQRVVNEFGVVAVHEDGHMATTGMIQLCLNRLHPRIVLKANDVVFDLPRIDLERRIT